MVGDFPITTGQVQNPYQEFVITIPASQYSQPIHFAFDYIRILNAEYTPVASPIDDGVLNVQFHGSGALTPLANAGIGLKLPRAIPSVRFYNADATTAIEVRVGLAIGEIFDDRFNIIGDVAVVNGTTSPLLVSDTTAQTALNGIDADTNIIQQALTDGESGASLLTQINSGTSYATTNNANLLLFSGVTNTNGAIIRTLSLTTATGNAGRAGIQVATNELLFEVRGENDSAHAKDIYIAAGDPCTLLSNDVNAWARASYEVL